jgi:hypothetical protein
LLLLTLRSVVVAGSARPFTLSIEQISSHFRLHALPVLRSEAPVLALGLDVHLTHLFCTPACTESLLFSLGFRHPLLPSLSDPFPLPICRCDYSPSSFTSSLLHCSAIRRPPRGDHQGRALQEHRSQGHRPGGEAPLGDLTRFLPLDPTQWRWLPSKGSVVVSFATFLSGIYALPLKGKFMTLPSFIPKQTDDSLRRANVFPRCSDLFHTLAPHPSLWCMLTKLHTAFRYPLPL